MISVTIHFLKTDIEQPKNTEQQSLCQFTSNCSSVSDGFCFMSTLLETIIFVPEGEAAEAQQPTTVCFGYLLPVPICNSTYIILTVFINIQWVHKVFTPSCYADA